MRVSVSERRGQKVAKFEVPLLSNGAATLEVGVNDGTGFPRSTVSHRKFAEDNAFAFMSSHSYSVVTARGVFLSIACSPCFARRRDVFQALIGD